MLPPLNRSAPQEASCPVALRVFLSRNERRAGARTHCSSESAARAHGRVYLWLNRVEMKTFLRTLTLTNLEENMINVFFNANRLERVYSGGNLQSELKSEQNIFSKIHWL